jgi:hypothetical protein
MELIATKMQRIAARSKSRSGPKGIGPDPETLVNGVDVGGKKMRFLRRIPIDPMTGGTDWGLRAMQDDPDSDSWNGERRERV